MARADQVEIRARIVIEQPVAGVLHSLQSKDGHPLDPKRSAKGEPLAFDFPLRIALGPKFFGDQVRREGKERRFVYIRVGQSAGDFASPWSRRMKIDIHDTPPELLDRRWRTAAECSRSPSTGPPRMGRRRARPCGRRGGGWCEGPSGRNGCPFSSGGGSCQSWQRHVRAGARVRARGVAPRQPCARDWCSDVSRTSCAPIISDCPRQSCA